MADFDLNDIQFDPNDPRYRLSYLQGIPGGGGAALQAAAAQPGSYMGTMYPPKPSPTYNQLTDAVRKLGQTQNSYWDNVRMAMGEGLMRRGTPGGIALGALLMGKQTPMQSAQQNVGSLSELYGLENKQSAEDRERMLAASDAWRLQQEVSPQARALHDADVKAGYDYDPATGTYTKKPSSLDVYRQQSLAERRADRMAKAGVVKSNALRRHDEIMAGIKVKEDANKAKALKDQSDAIEKQIKATAAQWGVASDDKDKAILKESMRGLTQKLFELNGWPMPKTPKDIPEEKGWLRRLWEGITGEFKGADEKPPVDDSTQLTDAQVAAYNSARSQGMTHEQAARIALGNQ